MDYAQLASPEVLKKTTEAITKKNIEVFSVNTKEEAFAKVVELIPAGASVHNGASTTLQQIGMVDYLKGDKHGWNNMHTAILAESDPEKQKELRNKALFSEYYLGSVHAVTESGELVWASASGSQLPHIAFTSSHLVFVVGAQKIVPTLEEAFKRIREYIFPLEDARMKSVGMGGSIISKLLILEQEPAFMNRKVQLIFVNEKLGF